MDFFSYSKDVGNDVFFIQGRAGNTSFKEDKYIYIKPSGTLLKDLNNINDFSKVDLKLLSKLDLKNLQEEAFIEILQKYTLTYKPSMELIMHLLYSEKYLFHTHPILVNALSCLQNGKNLVKEVLKGINFDFIDYYTPGVVLAQHMQNKKYNIAILKNHGMVVASDNLDEINSIYQNINNTISIYLNIDNSDLKDYNFDINLLFDKTKILFPDHAIYFCKDSRANILKLLEHNREYSDVALSIRYIHYIANKLNLKLDFLNDNEVEDVLGSKLEKQRIKKI